MQAYLALSLASCRSLFISGLFILAGSSVCSLQTLWVNTLDTILSHRLSPLEPANEHLWKSCCFGSCVISAIWVKEVWDGTLLEEPIPLILRNSEVRARQPGALKRKLSRFNTGLESNCTRPLYSLQQLLRFSRPLQTFRVHLQTDKCLLIKNKLKWGGTPVVYHVWMLEVLVGTFCSVRWLTQQAMHTIHLGGT